MLVYSGTLSSEAARTTDCLTAAPPVALENSQGLQANCSGEFPGASRQLQTQILWKGVPFFMPLAAGSHDKDIGSGQRAGEGSRELEEKPRREQLEELLEEVGGAQGEPPSAKEIPSPGFTQRPG